MISLTKKVLQQEIVINAQSSRGEKCKIKVAKVNKFKNIKKMKISSYRHMPRYTGVYLKRTYLMVQFYRHVCLSKVTTVA